MNNSMFSYGNSEPEHYNFGKVAIESYITVLQRYVGRGLTKEDIQTDKALLWSGTLLPWFRRIVSQNMKTDIEGFEDYFTKYYSEETYYEEALKQMRAIRGGLTL